MFTPTVTLQRRNLRNAICERFPGMQPSDIFTKIAQPKCKIIFIQDLEEYCKIAEIPAVALDSIFAPYGVKDVQIALPHFITFLNDDFPVHDNTPRLNSELTDKQTFILSKFLGILRTKFGSTLSQRWNSALTRNPPNTLNTTLRLSALCHLYQDMNLPFTSSEFVDALFAFYGEKVEGISFSQFGELFSSIQ
ncbi:hypothetical protein TRFO_38230 [Tritrichomonas foetus]|uniref:Uncharacterized protein n=1 Tax=Tritrichomonas foetus TaxID=1144522 RepID=A0A1J4JD78_9EUKA|nr:hypothetical protein TRFO_38230 [Tritrichomonas foetus]|eukprot:OHS95635.1 hypothetical protein TRFO_38230 [Tritrichomonas foetus]